MPWYTAVWIKGGSLPEGTPGIKGVARQAGQRIVYAADESAAGRIAGTAVVRGATVSATTVDVSRWQVSWTLRGSGVISLREHHALQSAAGLAGGWFSADSYAPWLATAMTGSHCRMEEDGGLIWAPAVLTDEDIVRLVTRGLDAAAAEPEVAEYRSRLTPGAEVAVKVVRLDPPEDLDEGA